MMPNDGLQTAEQPLFKAAQIHPRKIYKLRISSYGYNTEGKITALPEPVSANVLYTNQFALGYCCYAPM